MLTIWFGQRPVQELAQEEEKWVTEEPTRAANTCSSSNHCSSASEEEESHEDISSSIWQTFENMLLTSYLQKSIRNHMNVYHKDWAAWAGQRKSRWVRWACSSHMGDPSGWVADEVVMNLVLSATQIKGSYIYEVGEKKKWWVQQANSVGGANIKIDLNL